MKTRCPECQTVFRITPEQLKARAGKVRCGRCRTAFNALGHLLKSSSPRGEGTAVKVDGAEAVDKTVKNIDADSASPSLPQKPPRIAASPVKTVESVLPDSAASSSPLDKAAKESVASSQKFAATPATDGLIVPRDTTEIPGYSKWSDGVMAVPAEISTNEPVSHWPFKLAVVGLVLILVGQVVFHFRGELAASTRRCDRRSKPSHWPWVAPCRCRDTSTTLVSSPPTCKLTRRTASFSF